VLRKTVESGDACAFTENRGAIGISVEFTHARERFLQKSGKSTEAAKFVAEIRGEHRGGQTCFELFVGFLLVSGLLRENGKLLASIRGVSFPEKNKRLLEFDVKLVPGIVRERGGTVVLFTRGAVIAHER